MCDVVKELLTMNRMDIFESIYTELKWRLKRCNGTFLNKNHALLSKYGFYKPFWDEADLHTFNLFNIVSSSANRGVTPYEPLFGRNPNISELRVFGFSNHILISREIRKGNFESNKVPKMLFALKNSVYEIRKTRKIGLCYCSSWGFKKWVFWSAQALGKNSTSEEWWNGEVMSKKDEVLWIWIVHISSARMRCKSPPLLKKSSMRCWVFIKRFWGYHLIPLLAGT